MNHKKILETVLGVSMRVRANIKDKYIYHLNREELLEIDRIIEEELRKDPRIRRHIVPAHPYVDSEQYTRDLAELKNV